jgi:uncharacterized protein
MIEFTKQIAEKWNISPALSEIICDAFEKGDTPYYRAEYRPEVAVELSLSCLWDIYDFLSGMAELVTKKKRVINALKKAGKLTQAVERRVQLTASPFELDDMLLPLRPNPRSRGQLAIKKGLEPLADFIARQEEGQEPIDAMAQSFVGKDPTLASAADVMVGVKDVLAERFAYDDTVRAMVRDFAYDDGFFEVTLKNKQDPRFAQYSGKQIPLVELTKEEMLSLLAAEDDKSLRLKLGVQLFRITELLRHHFIQNPDFSGFDLLCEIIDDSWQRLLQPIIERDVKVRLRLEAEAWAAQQIAPELEKKYADENRRGTQLIVDAAHPKLVLFICVSGHGDLLSATSEKKQADGTVASYDRLRQFYLRYRPAAVVICDNERAAAAETIVMHIVPAAEGEQAPAIIRFKTDPALPNPSESEWLRKKYESLLDADTAKVFGAALQYLKPVVLLPLLGTAYYQIHPLQKIVSKERFVTIVDRIVADAMLHRGIAIKDIADSPLRAMTCVSPEILQAVKAADAKEPFTSKNSILAVHGMTEVVFRNIAGFVVIPQADDMRDRSLAHPDHYAWLDEASEQLNASLETIMGDPEILRSFIVEDFLRKAYLEKKLIPQLRNCQRLGPAGSLKIKRKLKLNEIKEGSIVSGRVTNITPFGVFVNINAVCDGLIHISQLADDYVETPEQVVALHDKVDVRILKVDVKKRRISLSMKNLGKQGPRVKPTQGQLNTLAEYFNAR